MESNAMISSSKLTCHVEGVTSILDLKLTITQGVSCSKTAYLLLPLGTACTFQAYLVFFRTGSPPPAQVGVLLSNLPFCVSVLFRFSTVSYSVPSAPPFFLSLEYNFSFAA
jgi:hypothetical protein